MRVKRGRHSVHFCFFALLALAAVSPHELAVAAKRDMLASLCEAGGESSSTCDCAAHAFRRASKKSEVAIYADISRLYLARLKAAKPEQEAWDEAIGAVAIRKRMLPADLAVKASNLRDRHQGEIHQCAEATAAIPQKKAPQAP